MSKRKYKSFGYLGNTNQCTAKTKAGVGAGIFGRSTFPGLFVRNIGLSIKRK